MIFTEEYFMQQAYLEAEKAYEAGEIPVGAVVVLQDKIIGSLKYFSIRVTSLLFPS